MLNRIIIAHDYVEGSASSNRILCFAKGYRDHGLEVLLVLFSPRNPVDLKLEGVDVQVVNEPGIRLRLTRRLMAVAKYVRTIKKLYIPGRSAIHIYRTPWWGFFFNRRFLL